MLKSDAARAPPSYAMSAATDRQAAAGKYHSDALR